MPGLGQIQNLHTVLDQRNPFIDTNQKYAKLTSRLNGGAATKTALFKPIFLRAQKQFNGASTVMMAQAVNKEVSAEPKASFKEFSTMASTLNPVSSVSGTIEEEMSKYDDQFLNEIDEGNEPFIGPKEYSQFLE